VSGPASIPVESAMREVMSAIQVIVMPPSCLVRPSVRL
jgi:hypothetical protein